MLRKSTQAQNTASQTQFFSEFKSSSKKDDVRFALSIDVGSGTLVIAICEGGVVTVIESPIDGTLLPTAVFEDPKTKKRYLGSEAMQRALDAPDCLAMHIKKALAEHPNEKLFCQGKYTATEMTTALLDHAFDLLVSFRRDLKDDYPMFGGNTYFAEAMVFTLTVPSHWGVVETTSLKEAVVASKFGVCDGFMKEPTAAARHLAHVPRVSLRNGDTILVVDLGAHTSDIQLLRYRNGSFDVESAATGDGHLGGHDFTNALCVPCAAPLNVNWNEDICGDEGFQLKNVPEVDRESVIEILQKMDKEVKPRLALMDSVDVVLNLPNGRKKFNMTRAKAAKLWRPLFAKLRKCVTTAVSESGIQAKDIDHVLVVGGTAGVHGIASEVAKALGRKESDLVVCKDSAHVIASGAAEHAFHQEEFSQSIQDGLGLQVLNRGEGYVNACLIEPGQVVTSDGFYGEWSGYSVVRGDRISLLCVSCFAVKTGVRVEMQEGRHTLLTDSEVVYFEPIEVSIEHWPEGEHPVDLGITADVNGNLALLIRPKNNAHIEVLAVPLKLAKGTGKQSTQSKTSQAVPDAVLVLDCSASMDGEKISAVIEGALEFTEDSIKDGASVGIVAFPSGNEVAKCVAPLMKNKRKLQSAIKCLKASGATHTDAALRIANKMLAKSKDGVAVLYTDGHPHNRDEAFKAAIHLKQDNFLICVPIGDDVNRPDLRRMASDGGYVDGVVSAEQIPESFDEVHSRIQYGVAEASSGPTAEPRETEVQEPGPQQEAKSGEPEDDSWDDVEGFDEEAA